jgi:hypothetical protein
MNKFWMIALLVLVACGGNLSDEQRRKIKQEMEEKKIVRITEPEIMTGALEKGHSVIKSIGNNTYSEALVDSIEKKHGVKIHYAVPGGKNSQAIEQELIDAYITGIATGAADENLQKVYNNARKDSFDTLLYSKPSITRLPDGTEQLDGIWNIYIPKKQVVLEISKSK